MINLHIRRLAVVYMRVEVLLALSQMSFIAGHILEGQGTCYFDNREVEWSVYVQYSVHVCMMGRVFVSAALDELSWNNEKAPCVL